jgi:hypothetical protein
MSQCPDCNRPQWDGRYDQCPGDQCAAHAGLETEALSCLNLALANARAEKAAAHARAAREEQATLAALAEVDELRAERDAAIADAANWRGKAATAVAGWGRVCEEWKAERDEALARVEVLRAGLAAMVEKGNAALARVKLMEDAAARAAPTGRFDSSEPSAQRTGVDEYGHQIAPPAAPASACDDKCAGTCEDHGGQHRKRHDTGIDWPTPCRCWTCDKSGPAHKAQPECHICKTKAHLQPYCSACQSPKPSVAPESLHGEVLAGDLNEGTITIRVDGGFTGDHKLAAGRVVVTYLPVTP